MFCRFAAKFVATMVTKLASLFRFQCRDGIHSGAIIDLRCCSLCACEGVVLPWLPELMQVMRCRLSCRFNLVVLAWCRCRFCSSVIWHCSNTSVESHFYLTLYASVGKEPKHIMAWWHFCNSRQLLCLGSSQTEAKKCYRLRFI